MNTFNIDPMHSEVGFKIKHLMISNVSGNFGEFNATVKSEKPDFTDAAISFEASVNSISTNNGQRDEHLKSADFFDAGNHPKIEFQSTSLAKVSDGKYKLDGTLNIRGNKKPVSLDVDYLGNMKDFYGNEKYGFEINGKISRKEFGLTWDGVTEAGGIVVSDEVKLHANVQFQKA
jgi:polyisoprenoid-binding protein YceI